MSRWKRMRPLPMIAGGIVTAILALWLLPKPATEVDPLMQQPSEPAPSAMPVPAPRDDRRPAPTPVPSSTTPVPTAVPVAPVQSAPVDGPHPVSSRGFRQAMRSRYDAIIACYDQWAEAQADIPERQVIRFYIEPGDEISRVDRVEMMDSPTENGPMEACVLDVMIEAEFEPSDAMTVYTFPFRFGEAPDK